MNYPSISIVTPSFNQDKFIKQTIESVLDQRYPNLEYIIIDGGSTDDSVNIIRKYGKHLKYWVSEKDKGQANAINKGLALCTGSIFNWLNSDDYLETGALEEIANAFSDTRVDLVAGRVNNFSESESEVVANQYLDAEGLMSWRKGVHFVQPGVWLRRQYLAECKGLDEQFHYAFDWDLLIRYLYMFPNVKYLDKVLVHFRLHGASKTVSVIDKFAEEERRIIEKIIHSEEFKGLQQAGLFKLRWSHWTSFLEDVYRDTSKNKLGKLKEIVSNLDQQPMRWNVMRMTLGSMKNIIIR